MSEHGYFSRRLNRYVYFNLDRMEKECTKCETIQPVTNFYTDQRTPTGLNSWCKACCNEAQALRRYKYGRPDETLAQRRRRLDDTGEKP